MSLWDITNFLVNPFKDPNEEGETTTDERLRRGLGEVYPDVGLYVPQTVEKAFLESAKVPEYSEPYRAKLLETIRSYFPEAADLQKQTGTYVPTYAQGLKQEYTPSPAYIPASFQTALPFKAADKFGTTTKAPSTPQTGYENYGYLGGTYVGAPQWKDSQYYEAGGDIGDVTNHPSFKAFESALTGALAGRSRQIADEMAKRGILSSGASKQAYEGLASSAQQAIAGEMARLAEKPIEAALIEKYVNEPKRRTEFESAQNQARMKYLADEAARKTNFVGQEAQRGTDFGKWISDFMTKQGQEEASRQDTMNRWLGDIRQKEADREQQARENNLGRIIDIAKTETDAEKEYQDASRNVALKNWALRMDALKDPVNLLMHVVSEGTSPLQSMIRAQGKGDSNAQKASFAAELFGE